MQMNTKPFEHFFIQPASGSPDLAAIPLGWFPTWIVGRRYYSPAPLPDMALLCERQPDNLSDPDAIVVYATHGGRVGYLPRHDSAYLAPLLDRAAIRLTARLAGDDAPHNRTPIRLEVWADISFATLRGPEANTSEAIWHAQLLLLWQNHSLYSRAALDAYRTSIRDLAHSNGLWPETQLLYRLLKGAVADGAAAEEQARKLAAELAAEADEKAQQARKDAVRKAFSCEPAGALLAFGHLRILPLRASHPASVKPLTQALRDASAVISPRSNPAEAGQLQIRHVDDTLILATHNERLDTTAGVLRVGKDTLIAPEDKTCSVPVWIETGRSAFQPIFLRGAEQPEPELPALPPEATGFAMFRGDELLHINLFAHPFSATAALESARRMNWSLKPASAVLDQETAAAKVSHILTHARFFDYEFDAIYFGHQPGVLKGNAALPGLKLAFLRLSINEAEFVSHVSRPI